MKADNLRLPQPNKEELHYTKKADYVSRMYKEATPEKYGLTNSEFANWIIRTFDQFYLNNKHITYRESLKLI